MNNVPGQRPEQDPYVSPFSRLRILKNVPRAFAGLLAVLLVCVVALASIGFAHWTFSSEALIGEVANQVYGSAGLYIAAKGRSTFSLLPRPHIAIERVALADPGAFVTLEADRLDGDVRLLPLLARRLEIDRLTLTRPAIRSRPAEGAQSWGRSGQHSIASHATRRAQGALWHGVARGWRDHCTRREATSDRQTRCDAGVARVGDPRDFDGGVRLAKRTFPRTIVDRPSRRVEAWRPNAPESAVGWRLASY